MRFAADIKAFAKKTGQNAEKQAAATLFKFNSLVVNRTPVDKGQARGGWVASVGSPSRGKGRADKSGKGTIRRANAQAEKAVKNRDIYYLVNNVQHIAILEYGGYPKDPAIGSYNKKKKKYEILSKNGYSVQAPSGMVRISMQEIKGLIGGR